MTLLDPLCRAIAIFFEGGKNLFAILNKTTTIASLTDACYEIRTERCNPVNLEFSATAWAGPRAILRDCLNRSAERRRYFPTWVSTIHGNQRGCPRLRTRKCLMPTTLSRSSSTRNTLFSLQKYGSLFPHSMFGHWLQGRTHARCDRWMKAREDFRPLLLASRL